MTATRSHGSRRLGSCSLPKAPGRSGVLAELDDIAVRVLHVYRDPLTSRSEAGCWAIEDVKVPAGHHMVQVAWADHQAQVVHVPARRDAREQIDDGGGIDAKRRERHLTIPPFLEAHWGKTEFIAVPGKRPLDVGDGEHHMIESRYPHTTHGRGIIDATHHDALVAHFVAVDGQLP